MTPPNTLIVFHRSSHHATPGGYGRLTDYIDCTVIPERELRIPPWRIQRLMTIGAGAAYSTTSVSKELMVAREMIKRRPGVVHFLNVENDFRYTGLWSRPLKWRTLGTFHFPPSHFARLFPDRSWISRLDAAVCVSTSQVNAVKELLGHDRVWYVPLGIDTDFFSPGTDSEHEAERLCLFVGTHLRDFDTLARVADRLAAASTSARIVAILPDRFAADLPARPRLEVRTSVSDEELRSWYRRASLLLLPLKDATATSSILEALACGVPVVSNATGGVSDYVTPECGLLYPLAAADEMTEGALRILGDKALRGRMAAAARARALQFAWPAIASSISRVYSETSSWRSKERSTASVGMQ